MTGGLGVANMGHNHPRVLETRKKFIDRQYTEIHKNYLNRLKIYSFNSKQNTMVVQKQLNQEQEKQLVKLKN